MNCAFDRRLFLIFRIQLYISTVFKRNNRKQKIVTAATVSSSSPIGVGLKTE
jgi:hypothetical protein